MFDPRAESYEEYLARWERELADDEDRANPFEPAEYKAGKPYPPKGERWEDEGAISS